MRGNSKSSSWLHGFTEKKNALFRGLSRRDQPATGQRVAVRLENGPARLLRKKRAQRRHETARRVERSIRTRDHADQRREMLDRAVAYSPGRLIGRIGLFEDQRSERGQAFRSQTPHPALTQLVDSADRAENGAAEPVLRHDAIERGEQMTQCLLA